VLEALLNQGALDRLPVLGLLGEVLRVYLVDRALFFAGAPHGLASTRDSYNASIRVVHTPWLARRRAESRGKPGAAVTEDPVAFPERAHVEETNGR